MEAFLDIVLLRYRYKVSFKHATVVSDVKNRWGNAWMHITKKAKNMSCFLTNGLNL